MPDKKNPGHNSKKEFLSKPVEHIDITSFDSRKIISSMNKMSFVSREIANATKIPVLHTVEIIDWYTGGPKPEVLKRL